MVLQVHIERTIHDYQRNIFLRLYKIILFFGPQGGLPLYPEILQYYTMILQRIRISSMSHPIFKGKNYLSEEQQQNYFHLPRPLKFWVHFMMYPYKNIKYFPSLAYDAQRCLPGFKLTGAGDWRMFSIVAHQDVKDKAILKKKVILSLLLQFFKKRGICTVF